MNPGLKVGDEIVVNTRARVVEVGPEMCTLELVELYQQDRIPAPARIYCPLSEIRSTPLPPERLPPEVPQ